LAGSGLAGEISVRLRMLASPAAALQTFLNILRHLRFDIY
jgi:hypothetical protein